MIDEYKIVIISGDDAKRGRNDGNLEYYGKIDDGAGHAFYLVQYIKENYSDLKLLNSLKTTRHPITISSLLAMHGNILFLNVTDYKECNLRKYGKIGMLFMPDNVSDKMRESLDNFCKEINEFDVEMNYNLRLIDGMIDADTFRTMGIITPSEMVNRYFDGNIKRR